MIENLQVLRAFAAINVVFFHIIGTAESYGQPTHLFSVLEGWGANGVDVFFVISGFMMLHIQMKRKRSVVAFYKSRLIRVLPAYWLLTTVVILAFLVAPNAFRELIVTAERAFASYLFVSSLFTGETPIVLVGWTLEWEMLFYTVFGAALLFDTWKKIYFFVFLLLGLVSFASSQLIVFEFFAGMLVAYVFNNKRLGTNFAVLCLLVGAALLLLTINQNVRQLDLDRELIWGVPSFLIVLGAVHAKQVYHPVLRYLGDASYSIYLVQILTLPIFYKLVSVTSFDINNDILSLMCLMVSVLAGVVMFALFEKPTTDFLSRKFSAYPK
ncbi:acyltransferase [Amphritea sp.]|uniref:acyltransferase family protein n=1 Tax=Amphritea sp. TaxID=1872502 RepID=UPI0025BD11E8|nr:acyltransferase [Amphritea sp.]